MPNTTRTSGRKTAKAKIDQTVYRRLLSKTMPVVIETEEENDRMLEVLDSLMNKERSPEEEALLKLVSHLIGEYEDRVYPIEQSSPLERLKYLMEAKDLKPRDLLDIFGARSTVSQVLAGKRQISRSQALKLAERFCLRAEAFLK
jgi:HTH-type transcriptional regulator/antitoxin HigA